MRISEINIVPIKPRDGLVAFASFVIDGSLYCGSVGIMTQPFGGYRLVYPTKRVGDKQYDIFHPINHGAGSLLQKVVVAEYEKITQTYFDEVTNHGRYRHGNTNTQSI